MGACLCLPSFPQKHLQFLRKLLISLWIFLLLLFDPLFSAFFLHAPNSHTETQILTLTNLNQGKLLKWNIFMKKIRSVLCTSGSHTWSVASKLAMQREQTTQHWLHFLSWHWVHIIVSSVKWQAHQKCHGMFPKQGRCTAGSASSQTLGGDWEAQWSQLWTSGLPQQAVP